MAYYFDETYYITSKLAQLQNAGINDPATGSPYTERGLYRAFENSGLSARQHYEAYGRGEKLNPNPYFNEAEYLEAKARQLNSLPEYENPYGDRAWTAADVLLSI